MPNRLAGETSPYLLQHADNPVDWHPWGEQALAQARAEDKPILLSVGYSACHWCHVMAHESFEDAETAALMNRLFINVKVDREERPDLDQIYQTAHQMLTGRGGGWPLTVLLAPDGAPFFAGTYFPKVARYGMPAFGELLERLAAIWRERRADVEAQGEQVKRAFSRLQAAGSAGGVVPGAEFTMQPIDASLAALGEQFDPEYGGFAPMPARAPKFPHPCDLELCLRRHASAGDAHALTMVDTSLEHMCAGGIYDQLGGGFCRYSVDRAWMIPHFEKMLYDNAALLALLADAHAVTGRPAYARAAAETAAWVMREMQSPAGGYYSSLDADSEHEEGRFYVWQRDAVARLLTPDEFSVFAPRFGLDLAENFEQRHWHLYVARDWQALAAQAGVDVQTALARVDAARGKLFAEREKRVRPGRDEKILVSWNALMIRGMARAARAFGRAEWLASARSALEFIRATMWREGRLLATSKDGRAHLTAYLDDYAYLIAALLELMQADFSVADLEFAQALADVLLDQFEDAQAGGFWFTARDHEALIHRPKPGHDGATPSGNGVAAFALQRLAALTGESRYQQAAERTLGVFYPAMRERAAGYGALAIALDEALRPPTVIILRGEPAGLAAWSTALAGEYRPSSMVLAIPTGRRSLPELLDKPLGPAPVNAWVCQGVSCLPPFTDLEALKSACKQADIG